MDGNINIEYDGKQTGRQVPMLCLPTENLPEPCHWEPVASCPQNKRVGNDKGSKRVGKFPLGKQGPTHTMPTAGWIPPVVVEEEGKRTDGQLASGYLGKQGPTRTKQDGSYHHHPLDAKTLTVWYFSIITKRKIF